MKKRIILLGLLVCLTVLFSACVINSNKKISQKSLDSKKAAYEQYLKDTYPGETFTVSVWSEYGEKTGAAGLPDYKGELLRSVVTDSKGNRFKVFELGGGKYSDDYKEVLDGNRHYNDKGQEVIYKEDGTVWFVNE